MTTSRILMAAALAATGAWTSRPASAQATEYRLRADGGWEETRTPEPGSDEAVIADARRLLADDQPGAAFSMIDRWLKRVDADETGDNIWIPDALVLRGDARVATGSEYSALFDYESAIRRFPQSDAFVRAIERELDIAREYSMGLSRRVLGLRIGRTSEIAAELMIRAQERLPGSVVAERAAIDLADHYYRRREMALAADAYGLYLDNFPAGEHRTRAMQRQIYANIARFKGPSYNAVSLIDASEQIRRFSAELPLESARLGVDSALLSRVDESLAGQKLQTARWYITRGELPSARFTLRRLLKDHPRTAAASEALQIMSSRGWIDVEESANTEPES